MDRIYLDIETCGFHGLGVTIQYAVNDGPIHVHDVWYEPAGTTLDLIESFLPHCVVGYNLTFDWFHVCKLYTTLMLIERDAIPADHIERIAVLEEKARDGPCVKPASAVDLMLEARRGPLSMVMEKKDVYVKKVPSVAADVIAKKLNETTDLPDILFARKKVKSNPWVVADSKDEYGEAIEGLKDVVLRFKPGGGLKHLGRHLFGADATDFAEISLPKNMNPEEIGFAPYALAVGSPGKWNGSWPDLIQYHAMHWKNNAEARKYAAADIDLTRKLDLYFNTPEPGHYDSLLAVQCAAARWKGFALDIPALQALRSEYFSKTAAPQSPNMVKEWINEVIPDEFDRHLAWVAGTDKNALLRLAKMWEDINPEAARRAQAVLEARQAKKKIELLDKLITAGRFHVSVKIIGTLTGRMSGTDGLNATGVDRKKEVRKCFPLKFLDEVLFGGDMKSFEVAIAEAYYEDPELRRLLTMCDKCEGQMSIQEGRFKCESCGCMDSKSFHGLFGAEFYPDLGYEGVMATKGLKGDFQDFYAPSKTAAFAVLYGAQGAKLSVTLRISESDAVAGYNRFWRRFHVAGRKRITLERQFTAIQDYEYVGFAEYVDSLLGYKRYYKVESEVVRSVFDLSKNLPPRLYQLKNRVTRSKRGEQTVAGACQSALMGCAFGMQNKAQRQTANHKIQATGAEGMKRCQVAANSVQPVGVHPWVTRSFIVHDELQSCNASVEVGMEVKRRVEAVVEEFRKVVPLASIAFDELDSWAEK